MALLFMESFDHHGGSTALFAKWDNPTNAAIAAGASAHTGAAACRLSTLTAQLIKTITPGDVFILGVAMRLASIPGASTQIITFYEGGTSHVNFTINASGFLVARRGTTVLATATSGAFTVGAWFYLEFKAVIHDTLGSIEVRVDTVPVTWSATLTNVDTRNAATGVVDAFGFTGGDIYVDDIYCCDDSGSAPANDFLGICIVEALLPSPATPGDHQDFTCSTGTDHGALVDETTVNDDTDFTSSNTIGHQDTYHYPSLALTGTIVGVQTLPYLRKTDVGARTVAPLVRTGGVTYVGTSVSPTTNYKYQPAIRELNPNTGVAWTSADITALQAGLKIVT